MKPAAHISILLLSLLAGCAQLPPRPALPHTTALAPAQTSPLDQLAAPLEANHPGQSAFRLVVEGTEAFVSRVQSARMATRTLDVQSYIWHMDLTGRYFVEELLLAGDRGVRVRVLIDDMDARNENAIFTALSAHPNIEVRTFNPFASRHGALRFIAEATTSFERINRRMHNKSWIADNRIAVVGGRNVGDEYFGASEDVNFVDLDFAMVGPVVREASASFDRYWNSPAAYPIETLDPDAVTEAALTRLREELRSHVAQAEESRYAQALRKDDAIKRMVGGEWPMQWTDNYRFVSDDPLKVTMKKRDAQTTHVGATLVPLIAAAQTRLSIISPYFVPGEELTTRFSAAVKDGRQIRILTNSLAANDVAAVHGGYSRHRKDLLEGGVQIWELKPLPGMEDNGSLFGSSGASLHTKAFAVDGRGLFVGSYNLDPRSTWLNCEQGVFAQSEPLALQLEQIFERQTAGEHAWRVSLDAGKLRWTDGRETVDHEPHASWGRRFQAWLARTLRLDAQL
ncbi:MAG TPA: phospholipase D family protein [Steroidobacteraceae bacterium]|nr:phospholipase D family protein [Steroidobacteraceae bacterium]